MKYRRRTFALVLFVLSVLGSLPARAGVELTAGYTYGPNSPSNTVTAANLNQHVNSALVNVGAVTNKATLTIAPAPGDYLLLAHTGNVYKIAFSNLIAANIIYSSNLVDGTIVSADLASSAVGQTNLALNAVHNTNLQANAVNGTNLAGTLDLLTNVIILPTNSVRAAISNETFVSAEFSLVVGNTADTAHGLGVKPKFVEWVLVCKTANAGYAAGDELATGNFFDGDNTAFAAGANATNVFLTYNASSPAIITKGAASQTVITAASWRAKCYARP